jgi:hypothetical protein
LRSAGSTPTRGRPDQHRQPRADQRLNPESVTDPLRESRLSPDAFVRAQIDLDRDLVYAAVTRIADSWRNPPGTHGDVLDRLERDGLTETAAALRD